MHASHFSDFSFSTVSIQAISQNALQCLAKSNNLKLLQDILSETHAEPRSN